MANIIFRIREPENEPVLTYAPGTKERVEIAQKLQEMQNEQIEIPLIIGGQEIRTGKTAYCIIPHKKEHILASYHMAGEKEVAMAIDAAKKAKASWESMPWEHRAAIFFRTAEILAGSMRSTINAATMLCQSKTAYQAEIDAISETTDFLRYNAYYMSEIMQEQPNSTQAVWNRMEYRPLEGFVLAVSPFNFTAIGANLVSAPAVMGNTVLWKPASTSVYSSYYLMKAFHEAGLPDGVINFLPGSGSTIGNMALADADLGGIHFTGSTAVFQSLWRTVATNMERYRTYPRMVGETGGKNYLIAHHSADIDALATALIRGSFEYQGQKCSASSRAYIAKSIWPQVKDKLVDQLSTISMGDASDFSNFMTAVIDKNSFDTIRSYIEYAKASAEAEIIYGGECDDSIGFFVQPTVILTTNPRFKTMEEEIFGPVLTVYVYDDADFSSILDICDKTSIYALTGSIFATDRKVIYETEKRLTHTAGNFFINDKTTGGVIGQQPFGGARASGTNDKAGGKLNLYRWVSPRIIKENLAPPKHYGYSFLGKE